MAPSRAFNDEVIIDGDALVVSGRSDIMNLAHFVSRHVVIGQGQKAVEDDPALLVPGERRSAAALRSRRYSPSGRSACRRRGSSAGPAIAIGTEVYTVYDGYAPDLPLLVSVSWSQPVEIVT